MKVYICDDSKSDLLRLQRYIQKYAQEENLQIETEEFTTAKEIEWDSFRTSVSEWEIDRYLAKY